MLNISGVVTYWATRAHCSQVNEAKPANEGVAEVRKAYEYTLDRVGQDINAGALWQEYVAFLQSPRPGSAPYQALFGGAVAGQEDAQRTTLLRSLQPPTLLPTVPAALVMH